METHPKSRPTSADEFPPTRPGIRTAALAFVAVAGTGLLYFWPIIKSYLGF